MPTGVIVDTAVCLQAPKVLWLAGIGDLFSKLTAHREGQILWDNQTVSPLQQYSYEYSLFHPRDALFYSCRGYSGVLRDRVPNSATPVASLHPTENRFLIRWIS